KGAACPYTKHQCDLLRQPPPLLCFICPIFFCFYPPVLWTSTLPLLDALPICHAGLEAPSSGEDVSLVRDTAVKITSDTSSPDEGDRKSTRLNSSHVSNSYDVFCLKKKILLSLMVTASPIEPLSVRSSKQ